MWHICIISGHECSIALEHSSGNKEQATRMVIFVLGAMEADKPKSHRLIKPQAAKREGRYWKNFSYREFIQQQKESIHEEVNKLENL